MLPSVTSLVRFPDKRKRLIEATEVVRDCVFTKMLPKRELQ